MVAHFNRCRQWATESEEDWGDPPEDIHIRQNPLEMYYAGLAKGVLTHKRDVRPIQKPNLGRLFPPQLSITDRRIPGILYHTWVYDFRKYCANNQVTREEEYQFLKTTPYTFIP